MKVLLVSSSSGSSGGGETYLYYLAKGLAQLGHEVSAFCSTSRDMDRLAESMSEFAEVKRIQFVNTYQKTGRSVAAAFDFGQQKRLCNALMSVRPDIVHINQQVAEDALDLVIAGKNTGAPFLTTIHIARGAHSLGARFGRLRDLVTEQVLRRANTTHITVAACAKRELIARLTFLTPERVRVIANGVAINTPNVNARESVRGRWGVRPGEIAIGTVGRLNPQKAPDFALDIIASLRSKGLPVRYIWIGDGPSRAQFLDKAQRLGIADAVRVDGWRDDVSECLQALDIFVLPSDFEGMPLALLEAMGAGLCCCVSNADGMIEAINHGHTGYVCEPRHLQSWSERLGELVKNSRLRVATGTEARLMMKKKFDFQIMARGTATVYQDVIDKHRA